MDDDRTALEGFGGTTRVFPLPNLVLFPNVLQGLHLFEPRYRQMTADSLASDNLLTIVLLKPGWDENYDDSPAFEEIGCLARILQHERLADGRYNLQVRGLSRVRLTEVPSDRLYRTARGVLFSGQPAEDFDQLRQLRRLLAEAVLPRFEPKSPAFVHLEGLFAGETPLGNLCDMLAFALPIPLELKQQLLTDTDVAHRTEELARALHAVKPAAHRQFPPDFSPN